MQSKQIRILLIGANLWYVGEGMFGPLLFVIMGVIQLIAAFHQAQILRVEVTR